MNEQLYPNQNPEIIKDILWCFTNIAAGTPEQIGALIGADQIFDKVIALLSFNIWKVRREAVFVFTNIFSTIARLLSAFVRGEQVARTFVTSSQHISAPSQASPQRSGDLSPFARWVGDLDDEVTEYISGQRLSQILVQAEKKSADVKQRRTARRLRETLLPSSAVRP